jgi:hypothetical protein
MRSILSNTALVLALAACQRPAPAPAPDAAPPASTVPAPTAASQAPAPPPTGAAKPPASGNTGAQHWQCGEVLLDARRDGETMHLSFSGRTLALPHVESFTGARFADDTGNAFMQLEDHATLILAGDDSRDCTIGDREVIVAKAQPAGLGFTGKTADGTAVVLEIQRTRCQDGMSGEAFEASARLVVGDKIYRGCGAFLVD